MGPLPQQPTSPFLWGGGGARLTPQEIALRRRMAQQRSQMAGDTSPVGHWTQGLGRILDGLSSGLENRRLAKAEAANVAEGDEIAKLLMPADGAAVADDVVLRALTSPYANDGTRKAAELMWEQRKQKPAAPHYWETNDGSLGMVGADGKPMVLYKDPTPKITWMTADNGDGTKTLVPMGPAGPLSQGGGGLASGAQPGAEPPAVLPPDFDFDKGGPTPPASDTFP